MSFYTQIPLPEAARQFGYTDRFMLFGSCFAENIGHLLADNKFLIDVNPFGILYNPLSVSGAIRRLLSGQPLEETELFVANGLYHSWMHHGSFSSADPASCLSQINGRLLSASRALVGLSVLVVTWGTAWVYRLKEGGQVVANCHKQPERLFVRERLTVEQIVGEWENLLDGLWRVNPGLQVLLTVSPIRHWKDGAHGNQLSKATLLLAADELNRRSGGRVAYFPSYEIMLDELRDYRFYAEDMLHPSPLAVDYIADKFCQQYLSAEARAAMAAWQEIRKALAHKPFHPESEAYRRFLVQTLLKMERIQEKFPYFDLSEEKMLIQSKLK